MAARGAPRRRAAALGLLLAPAVFAVLTLLGLRRGRPAFPLTFLISAVLGLPLAAVLTNAAMASTTGHWTAGPLALATATASLLITVLVAVLGALLFRTSVEAESYRDPMVRAAAISVVVAFAIPARITWLGPVITMVAWSSRCTGSCPPGGSRTRSAWPACRCGRTGGWSARRSGSG